MLSSHADRAGARSDPEAWVVRDGQERCSREIASLVTATCPKHPNSS